MMDLQTVEQLERDGYVALPTRLDDGVVAAMRSRVLEIAAATPHTHAGTLVAGGLVDDPLFDPTWAQDDIVHERLARLPRHLHALFGA